MAGKTKHGHATNGKLSPTYTSWAMMKSRCNNPKNPAYVWYGGAGVTVCDKWKTFAGFLADMGERPAGTWIDRIDPSKEYSAANCRWATFTEQLATRRPRGKSHGKQSDSRR